MKLRASSSQSGFVPPPSSVVYRNIAIVFLILTVLVVVGALWISSVAARVVVTAKQEKTSIVATVEIAKTPTADGLRGRVVQGVYEKIQEFTVTEKSATEIPSSNTSSVGTVKIINNSSKAQTLVQKTRLLTAGGKLYRIQKRVNINPKQSVNVEAVSDQTGPEYAIPAGVKLTIPGLKPALQVVIYAQTATAFGSRVNNSSGGKLVSADDLTRARKTLEDAAMDQALNALRKEYEIPEDWKVVVDKKILDSKTNTAIGATADSFIASEKIQVTAVFYASKDLEAILRQKLTDKLPEGRELVNFDVGSVTLVITSSDFINEVSQITATADAISRLSDKSNSISKSMIQGLTVEDARARLQAVEGVESVDIKLRPTWVSKLPTSPDHIELIVH